jgi:hypothetical protein
MRPAVRCAVAGLVLDLTAAVCSGLNLLSAQQTIALALPATLLTVGGMASAAKPGRAIARRGFQAGFLLGALLSFCRPASRRQDGISAAPDVFRGHDSGPQVLRTGRGRGTAASRPPPAANRHRRRKRGAGHGWFSP